MVLCEMKDATGWFGLQGGLGFTNSFEAELWGLRDGLTLCNNLNISSSNS